MKDRPDPQPEDLSASDPAADTTGASNGGRRRSRSLGFLGSWTFWLRLGVGMLILGAGVLIGLGIAWFLDENPRSGNGGSRGGDVITLEIEPSGEWFGEGILSRDGKRFRFIPIPGQRSGWDEDGKEWRGREWMEKEWWEEKELPRGEFGDLEGIYIPYDLLEEGIERVARSVERLIERVEGYLDEGRFPPGSRWPDRFGDGRGDWRFGREYGREGEFPGDRDYYQDESKQRDQDEYRDDEKDEESWGRAGERPFEGFGFPFGELMPGLAFLENCEIDFEDLLGMMEHLEGLDEGELEEGEDGLDGLFEEVEELFAKACETPSDN